MAFRGFCIWTLHMCVCVYFFYPDQKNQENQTTIVNTPYTTIFLWLFDTRPGMHLIKNFLKNCLGLNGPESAFVWTQVLQHSYPIPSYPIPLYILSYIPFYPPIIYPILSCPISLYPILLYIQSYLNNNIYPITHILSYPNL